MSEHAFRGQSEAELSRIARDLIPLQLEELAQAAGRISDGQAIALALRLGNTLEELQAETAEDESIAARDRAGPVLKVGTVLDGRVSTRSRRTSF